nr:hypothetical protein CFP56_41215 [Quercus suber]
MNNLFCFVDMATCFSKDRYARAKEKKNQPLSKISSPPLKKQKFGSSGGIIISSLVRTLLSSSPTVLIEELPSPPLTRKGKEKKEAFGIITFDEFFKGFELWQRWTLKHLSTTIDYFDLDFDAIDKEMMANERARTNEKAGAEGGDEGECLVDAPIDPPIDLVVDPAV